MQTIATSPTQKITISTPIILTSAKMQNYFEQLSEAIGPLDIGGTAAALLAEKRVEVDGKDFDIFDFAEALQTLAGHSLDSFIDFLRDDFDCDVAEMIFDFIN